MPVSLKLFNATFDFSQNASLPSPEPGSGWGQDSVASVCQPEQASCASAHLPLVLLDSHRGAGGADAFGRPWGSASLFTQERADTRQQQVSTDAWISQELKQGTQIFFFTYISNSQRLNLASHQILLVAVKTCLKHKRSAHIFIIVLHQN